MLEAHNIIKKYMTDGVETAALTDAGITVGKGEFVALVGRSGSGKSTFLNVLSTLLAPDGGELLFEGENLRTLSEKALNQLRHGDFSMIFQQHHLMPYLTAEENVLLPFMNRFRPVPADIRRRAKDCLDKVGLFGKYNRLPGRLSGGEQQRVAIARALVKQSKVLFADEPTGSLDKATGMDIMDLLAGVAEDGMSVVMVTHDTACAERAGKILSMEDGKTLPS